MIRLSEQSDLAAIMQITREAQQFIVSQGFKQWTNGYPSIELFTSDIEKHGSYVMVEDGEIIGFMTLLFEAEPVYSQIAWKSEEPYGVVHRSSICSKRRGHHDMNRFFEFAQAEALKRNIHHLRVDTHPQNEPMNKAIRRFGFEEVGYVHYGIDEIRIAYEKEF